MSEEMIDEVVEEATYDGYHDVPQERVDAFLQKMRALMTEGASDVAKLTRDPWRSCLIFLGSVEDLREKVLAWRPKQEAYAMSRKSGSFRLGIFERIRERTKPAQSEIAARLVVKEISTHLSSLQALASEHGPIVLAHYRELMGTNGDGARLLRYIEDSNLRAELGAVAQESSNTNELISEWKNLQSQFSVVDDQIRNMLGEVPVQHLVDLLNECGLPPMEEMHPLVWLGLAKPTTKGKQRSDGTRGVSVNANEGPRIRKEQRVTEETSMGVFTGIVHLYLPDVAAGKWTHIGDPTKQAWEQSMFSDLTVNFGRIMDAARKQEKDVRDCVTYFHTITGRHAIKSLMIPKGHEVPDEIPMGSDVSEVEDWLNS